MAVRRGVFVFIMLLVVLGGAILFATFALRQTGKSMPAGSVLVWDVPSQLDEDRPSASAYSWDAFLPDRPTVWHCVDAIRRAATDDRIDALVLHIDGIDWGWAKVAEVRDAVLDFGSSGKPVYASLEGGGEREFLLATAADVIGVPPLAMLQLDGLAATALFLRGTFDKLDVSPNFASVGQYKSGVETYTRDGFSPPARAALEALVDDNYGWLVDSLAQARGLPRDSIVGLLDRGPWTAEEAVAFGLVDTLLHPADVDTLAVREAGGERPGTRRFSRYVTLGDRNTTGPHVALIQAAGAIAEGRSYDGPAEGHVLGSETLIRALREARERESVRATVLRIDSPGGSAQASDRIWREVERCREVKPVIASMSDVAASGGYYIAVGADSIVAQPPTITGSIGVYGGKLNILGLYRKLGLSVETVTRGRHAEMLSPYKDFSPEEAARFQASMDVVYRTFVTRVADGRGMDEVEVDSVGQGRVWSAVDALDAGLIDGFGGFEEAFAMARAKAGIEPDEDLTVELYPRSERTFFGRLVGQLFDEEELAERLGALRLPDELKAAIAIGKFPAGAALMLMPYTIEIR